MMLLSFSALDITGDNSRTFSCSVNSIDDAFFFLNSIVKQKSQLLTIDLYEDGHSIQLPPEPFDGHLCKESIKQIELDWQQILSEPVNYRSIRTYSLITIVKKKIDNNVTYVGQLESAITQVEQQKTRIQSGTLSDLSQIRLLSRSDESLEQYQRLLGKAQGRLKSNVDLLTSYQN